MHVHVMAQDGEAKFWLEPTVELARNYRLSKVQLREIERIVEKRVDEIKAAWKNHFRG